MLCAAFNFLQANFKSYTHYLILTAILHAIAKSNIIIGATFEVVRNFRKLRSQLQSQNEMNAACKKIDSCA